MSEKPYETVYILRPDLTDEGTKKNNDKVSEVVQRHSGQIEQIKDLGKKPLAYPVAKQNKGHYFQLNFRGPGKVVEELERHLKLSEDVIRFLTVRPDAHEIRPLFESSFQEVSE